MSTISCKYVKMHVLGNDFVIVNAADCDRELSNSDITQLGMRQYGIGFDQILIYERVAEMEGELRLKIFNRDGSEASQCGNGCVALATLYFEQQTPRVNTLKIVASGGTVQCSLNDVDDSGVQDITIALPPPVFKPYPVKYKADRVYLNKGVHLSDSKVHLTQCYIGNHHVVVLGNDVNMMDTDGIAHEIQADQRFPDSVNVEFLEIRDLGRGYVHIFERGVGETQACGTGAAAAMAVGSYAGFFEDHASIEMESGSVEVAWRGENEPIYLTAGAVKTHEGRFFL